MSRPAGKQVKFLLTRVLTAAGATAVFVSLWASVAATASTGNNAENGERASWEEQPVEQDGWRWDPATQQWVAIEQAAPEPASAVGPGEQPSEQVVVVVERQPVYYYVTYVYDAASGTPGTARPAGVAAGGTPGAGPSAAAVAPSPGGDVTLPPPPPPAAAGETTGAPGGVPQAPGALPPPAAPAAPPPPAAPAAPAAPASTPPPAATVPPAPKPAAPPPTAAPKKTKGS